MTIAEEQRERLEAATQKCFDADRDGHSLRLFEPLPFGQDLRAEGQRKYENFKRIARSWGYD